MRAAFAYFTVLPAGRSGPLPAEALAWLPLVGAVVGLLAGAAGWAAALIVPSLAAVVAFTGIVVLTGALHLDGFLDACDALAASVPPQRRLEILRDPHHGTYALAGLAVAVPLWIGAVAQIPPPWLPPALAFAGGTARFAAVLNTYRLPYSRSDGSVTAFERRPNPAILAGATLPALACAWLSPRWLLLVVPAVLVALALGAFAARRLGGGITGDVYGACIVVAEVATVIGIAGALGVR